MEIVRIHNIDQGSRQSFENKSWSAPKRCPFCGHILKQIENTNIKVCTNKSCERSKEFFKIV